MKKHHLWGRKRPGPYTRLGNQIFDLPGKAMDTATDLTGLAYEGVSGAGSAAWNAGSNAFGAINEWADDHRQMDLDPKSPPWWEN